MTRHKSRAIFQQMQEAMAKQTETLVQLLQQNTQLTEVVRKLTERIELLTAEMHAKVVNARG